MDFPNNIRSLDPKMYQHQFWMGYFIDRGRVGLHILHVYVAGYTHSAISGATCFF